MAILHERGHGVPWIGAGPGRALGNVAAVGIRQRAMRGVAPLLASEVPRPVTGIARPGWLVAIVRPQPAFVLLRRQGHLDRYEALEAGVGPDERTVRADMPAAQAFHHGLRHRLVEQSLQNPGFVKPATPILAERRRVPGLLVQVEPDEPAQGHIAL